ncbi:aldehyde dehydrogenase family protein [Aurantiacibacter suaedae]|uniref:aldehyde dehydrogenase family protein n=1 Tax=Aurantiacibacter suaedae TaxID=2545755 RepID=UPI0010F80565|nr:aldehyde dehydrogenase family protein [Aurantiacibacter suaedae]
MDHKFNLLVNGELVAGASTFEVNTSTVWVNQHLAIEPAIPFHGAWQSSLGTELGEVELEEYTQAHILNAVVFG